MSTPERVLRHLLRANALFSGVCALVFAVPTRTLPALTGRPSSELINLGLGLLAFALLVGWLSSRQSLAYRWTQGLAALVVGLDVLWAVRTFVQVAGGGSFTPTGRWLFAALALVVLGLAGGQAYALWALHRRTPSGADSPAEPDLT